MRDAWVFSSLPIRPGDLGLKILTQQSTRACELLVKKSKQASVPLFVEQSWPSCQTNTAA
jgi:hypothetical protein